MRILTSILFSIFLVSSCTSKKTVSETPTVSHINEEELIKEGFVKGIVKDFSEEEGCGFLIVLDKTQQIIQPMKTLEASFLTSGITVWIKYRPIRPIQPKCNKGITVSIEAIKKG